MDIIGWVQAALSGKEVTALEPPKETAPRTRSFFDTVMSWINLARDFISNLINISALTGEVKKTADKTNHVAITKDLIEALKEGVREGTWGYRRNLQSRIKRLLHDKGERDEALRRHYSKGLVVSVNGEVIGRKSLEELTEHEERNQSDKKQINAEKLVEVKGKITKAVLNEELHDLALVVASGLASEDFPLAAIKNDKIISAEILDDADGRKSNEGNHVLEGVSTTITENIDTLSISVERRYQPRTENGLIPDTFTITQHAKIRQDGYLESYDIIVD